MSTPAGRRVIVLGGNGFLGSRICQHAVARGWTVTSISRSGEPDWPPASPPAWAHRVSWERADVLRPRTYAALLGGADAVVHSLGILLEADYKRLVSGKESPLAALRRMMGSGGLAPPQPGQRQQAPPPSPPDPKGDPEADLVAAADPGDDAAGGATPGQLSYELMNRDSALALARLAAREGSIRTMAYVSAAAGAPLLPGRYISTKREAETLIARDYPALRSVFVRPPLMYDSSRPATVGVAALAGAASTLTRGALVPLLGAAVMAPVRVDAVAQAVIEALEDEGVRGVVDPEGIAELAKRAWRRSMV